jgi:hypothetical protein
LKEGKGSEINVKEKRKRDTTTAEFQQALPG